MNLKNLNVVLIIAIIFSSSALMAQSKLKKTKKSNEQAVDARSVEQEEEEITTVYTYTIFDLKGKLGSYSAEMVIPKSDRSKVVSEKTLTAEKKAAYTARQQTYATEIDFLKTMQGQMMELIAVTNDQDREGSFKRFYFRQKVEIRE